MISIINYGAGNIASLENAFDYIGAEHIVVNKAEDILSATKLLLPGVGAFDAAMKNLQKLDLIDPIREAVLHRKTPIFGVCLGMQLLGIASEEGEQEGLGLIEATSVRLKPSNANIKVPNMGWLPVTVKYPSGLFTENDDSLRFYFAHSYHMQCNNSKNVLATAHYGSEITAAIQCGHIYGVQFHPEKSHRYGLSLLTKFARL